MIISHRFQTVFQHIPKNAGSAVRSLLAMADPECEKSWGYGFLPRHSRFGDTAHLPLIDLPPDRLRAAKNYAGFAILRDPLERFLSATVQHFEQHTYRKPLTPAQLLTELDSTRIRYDPAFIHFCPQHFFTHIGPNHLVKTLFRLDDSDFEARLLAFLTDRGFPVQGMHLERRNTAAAPPPNPGAEFDMEHFYQLYKRDYQVFGFTPPLERTFEIDADKLEACDAPVDFSAYDRIRFLGADFERGR